MTGKKIAFSSNTNRFVDFFHRLPLALERKNDKVFHFALFNLLGSKGSGTNIHCKNIGEDCLDLEKQLATSIQMKNGGNQNLYAMHDISSKEPPVPMNHILAKCETRMQMGNPIKVLTSGVEGVMREGEPQYLSGKYRMVVCPGGNIHRQHSCCLWSLLAEVYKSTRQEQKRLFGTTTVQNGLVPREHILH